MKEINATIDGSLPFDRFRACGDGANRSVRGKPVASGLSVDAGLATDMQRASLPVGIPPSSIPQSEHA